MFPSPRHALLDRSIEILRTVHRFDPCIACAVHLFDPSGSEPVDIRVH
jgi:hydrogenase large subunit